MDPHGTLGSASGRDGGQGRQRHRLEAGIGGTTGRPGGSIYHVTRSLERGRRARELLALDLPVPVKLMPARWPRAMARQLYLDCDGVLADFDKGATAVLGMPPGAFEKRHGLGRFWMKLAKAPDFYFGLPLLDGANELFEAVRHLDPVILTGLPLGDWAADQKVRWAAQHFPGTRIITTMASDKRNHAREGDVLVDDQLRHAHLWEEMGGVFIHHRSVEETLHRLKGYFDL